MGKQPRELDEKSLRLKAAARSDDGFFSTFVLRKISRIFTSALVETPIKPNSVTAISIIFGSLAAYVTAQGKYLVGAIALLFSLVLDCVDGEIARYKNQFSSLGAWLDALADRIKEFAYVGALIYSVNEESIWWLGVALVILQTLRHLSDYNFVALQKLFVESKSSPQRSGAFYWIKKIIHLPIGERWLLLAVLPLVFSVTETLRMLLLLGIFSFAYVILSRARHIARWPKHEVDAHFLRVQRDTLLPFPISASRISWTLPSFLRGCEFLAVLVIPLDVSPSIRFLLISAIALWHYTNLYDALQGRKPVFIGAGLRVAGRIGLCLIGHLLGLDYEICIFLASYILVIIVIRGGHNVAKGAV